MYFFIFILQTGRQGMDYKIKYFVTSQKMSQKSYHQALLIILLDFSIPIPTSKQVLNVII